MSLLTEYCSKNNLTLGIFNIKKMDKSVRLPSRFDNIGVFRNDAQTITIDHLRELRKKQGKCPGCAQQLFDVRIRGVIKRPLNVEGKVKNGHCLVCDKERKKKLPSGSTAGHAHGHGPSQNSAAGHGGVSYSGKPSSNPSLTTSAPHSRASQGLTNAPITPQYSYAMQQHDPTLISPSHYFRDDNDDATIQYEPAGSIETIAIEQRLPARPVSDGLINAQDWSPSSIGANYPRYATQTRVENQGRELSVIPYFPNDQADLLVVDARPWVPSSMAIAPSSQRSSSSLRSTNSNVQSKPLPITITNPPQVQKTPVDELCRALDQLGSLTGNNDGLFNLPQVLQIMKQHADLDMVQIKGLRTCGSILTRAKQLHQQEIQSQNENVPQPLEPLIPQLSDLIKWILDLTSRNDNSSLIANAFMILWAIAEFSKIAREAVADTRLVVPNISKVLSAQCSNADSLMYALYLLAAICRSPDSYSCETLFAEGRIIEDIFTNTEYVYAQPKLAEALARVMWTISTQQKLRHALKKDHATRALTELLNSHGSVKVIQLLVCRSLSNLANMDNDEICVNDFSNIDAVVQSVIKSIKTHTTEHDIMQPALSFLAMASPHASMSVLRETTEAVLETMAASLQSSDSILCDLTFLFFGRAVEATSGVLKSVSISDHHDNHMHAWKGDTKQLFDALLILTKISDQVDVSPLLPKEALGGVIYLMSKECANLQMVQTAFVFLTSICFDPSLCQALAESGAVQAIMSCLNNNTFKKNGNDAMAEQGVELIAALLWDNIDAMASVSSHDLSSLLDLLNKHRQHEGLLRSALVLLRNLCCNDARSAIDENIEDFVGYVFLILTNNPDEVSIQEEGITALWSLLSLEPTKAIDVVQNANGVEIFLNAMDRHSKSVEVQEAALASLGILATSEACATDICHQDGVAKAVGATKLHFDDTDRIEALHEKAAYLLYAMSNHVSSPFLKQSIIFGGGVSMVVGCLKNFVHATKLLLVVIKLLANLSQDESIDGMDTFAEERVHEILIELMNSRNISSELTENAAKLFLLIVSTRSSYLPKMDVIGVVISAMRNSIDCQEAQELGVAALGELSLRDYEAKDTIARLGGINCIVDAMDRFLPSAVCCEKGCVALWSLGVKSSNSKIIVEAGGVNTIMNSILAHITKETLIQSSFGALIALTSNSLFRKECRIANGTNTVVSVMKVHFNSSKLLEQGCNVLSNLAVFDQGDPVERVTEDVLETISRSMKIHPHSVMLQKSACRTFWNLSLIPYNIPVFKICSQTLQEVLFAASLNFPDEVGDRVHHLLNLIY